jgi:2-methylcitrate dehydratase PrpD
MSTAIRDPDSPRDRARSLLFDYLAVARRGAGSGPALAARRVIGGGGAALVDGTSLTASPDIAALVNGIAGHCIELDDTYEPASIHPGLVVWPAVLALADERRTQISGLLDAAIAGYDAACALGDLLDPALVYRRGFHPTGVCGPIAAATAAAELLDLNADERANATGIAASTAGGLLEFLADGSWTKPFHAGHAAANGILAARLAAAGYTGPRGAIDGDRGLLHAFGRRRDAAVKAWPTPGHGVSGTAVKAFPCCRYIHGTLDLLLELVTEEDLCADDVESVTCAVLPGGWSLVADPPDEKLQVRSTVDAQFSMPFAAALALTHRRAMLEDFENASNLAADLAPLMRAIHCVRSARIDAAYPGAWGAEVEVRTRAGAVLRRQQDHIKGSPARPLSELELFEKAVGLIGRPVAAKLRSACFDTPDEATTAAFWMARQDLVPVPS